MSIDSEKTTLKQYGQIVEFNDLKSKDVHDRPMYFIKESQIEDFSNHIINTQSQIDIPQNYLRRYDSSDVNCIKKDEGLLEVLLRVEGSHFIPDKILKDDILFFYKIHKGNDFFIIIKDEYIDEILNSEHSVFGMIDFSKGKTLLFDKSKNVKDKMKKFQEEINSLAKKYPSVLFVTISDSILINDSFKVMDEENNFQPDKLDFTKILDIFIKIRAVIKKIFQMDCYGVFDYGNNKGESLSSNLRNVFHTGIFSLEFDKMLDREKYVKKLPKEERGDIYLSRVLYKAFRYHLRKKYQSSPISIEPSASEWVCGDPNTVVAKIPDKPLSFPKTPL